MKNVFIKLMVMVAFDFIKHIVVDHTVEFVLGSVFGLHTICEIALAILTIKFVVEIFERIIETSKELKRN